jgi:gliding motility-associated-like protein
MIIRCAFLLALSLLTLRAVSQTITLTPNQTANQLATKLVGKGILLPGTGMTLNCNAQANGSFVNVNPTPNLSLAIDTGIILCTGRVLTVAGDTGINANRSAQATKYWGITTTDPQITSIAGTAPVQRDLCYLQFHFVPQGDTAYIDYVFASEDYPEYGCSQYVDAFGIFVAPPSSTTYTNYAKVPGTNVNVSINSINDTMKQTGVSNFNTYCAALGSGAPFIQHYTGNLINNHIVYDGMTKILRATIPVQSFQTHTMKIAIADIADGFFDSGIFLKQFSFTSKIKLEISEKRGTNSIPTKDTIQIIEGCNPGLIRFSRLATTAPLTVNTSFSGTATTSDYIAPVSFTIPVGSSVFNYDIQALLDTLKELPETLKIVFSVPSINYTDSVIIVIKDFANGVNVFNGKRDTAICSGRPITLGYTRSDTSFSAVWTPASNLSCTNCISTVYTAPSTTIFTTHTVYLRITSPGCPSADTPIRINVQPYPVLSLNPNIAYCKGDSAIVQVFPNPSTGGAYSYAWSPSTGLSSTTIANPMAKPISTQQYKVVVSTSAGCKDSINTTVKVSVIRDEIDSMLRTNTSCGVSNGSIRLVPKTGTLANPPYQYSLNGGITFVPNNVFNGLAVGTYNVAIKNVAGCRFDTTITIVAGSGAPTANFVIDSTSCGLDNGKARIIAKTGLRPITQTWRLSATVLSTDTFITNRAAGVYTLSIQDSLGCVVQYTIPIGASTNTAANFTITQPSCGLNNGNIIATPSAGIGPYSHSWSSGGTNNTLSSAGSGIHIHTLTDSKGCVKKDTLTLNTSQPFVISDTSTRSNCGLPNGSATVIVNSGGTSPYIYSWSNGIVSVPLTATSHSINGLSLGWYRFTIQDGKNCVKIDSVFVTNTPAVSLSINKTNTNCGLANGAISVNVITGKAPYSYSWSGGSSTRVGLAAGNYILTVTDSNGCTVAAGILLTNNSLPIASTTIVQPSCGLANGRITAAVSGARPKIRYLWSTGDTVSSISKLAPGPYSLTVTDSLGCQFVKRDTLVQVPFANFSDSVVQPVCRGLNGSIYLKNIVGKAPVTITWSNGSTATSLINRPAGFYSVIVKDSNNCKKTKTFELKPTSNPKLSFIVTHALCTSTVGSIESSVENGQPKYNYMWSTGDTTPTILNKPAGIYTLIVTDFFGCKDTLTDSVRRKPSPIYSDSFRVATCNNRNGKIHIYNVVGSGPFTYTWSPNDTATSRILNFLPANIYMVTITDVNGCHVTDTFNLNSNGSIYATYQMQRSKCLDSTGKLTVTIIGGTPPFAVNWSNGDKGLTSDSLKHGTYGIFIKDSLGCTFADSVKVKDSTNTLVAFTITNTRCDSNTGKILATPNSGVTPYKYKWQRFPRDTFPILDSLSVNEYKLRVIDSMGCIYDTAAQIRYTHYPQIKDSIVIETCSGGNGEIHIKIDSVISPIKITWNNVVDSTYKKTGLRGELYFLIRVLDSQKCEGVINATLPLNPTPIPSLFRNPPPCGNNLGLLEAIGTELVSYVWAPSGKTTKQIDSLAPGPYAVTVTDTGGCVFVLKDTLEYSIPPIITINKDRPNCGQFDGQIEIFTSSLYGSVDFKWKKMPFSFSKDSQHFGTYTIPELDSGVYVYRVIDRYGCIRIDTINLIDSSAHKLSFDVKNARCTDNNGSIRVTPFGGKGPYDIEWYDFSSLDSIHQLTSGFYHVTVKDNRNCVVKDSIEVKFALPPTLSMMGENSLCGNGKGKITSTISFGVTPFIYQWNPSGSFPKDRVNLNAGVYKLTVTDSLGCKDSGTIQITSQPALTASLSKTAAFCDLNNGTATGVITSGTPPYNAVWNGSVPNLNLIGADSGKHILHIIDSNNCERRDTIYVNRFAKPVINAMATNDNCTYKIGGITTTVQGGKTPLTYGWSHQAITTSFANNLGLGNYTVSVTDDLGCLVTKLMTITDSAGPIVALVVNGASCGLSNASIIANVSSTKTPLSYFWNNVAGSNTLSGINGGQYISKVIDARGCIKLDTVVLDTVKALSGAFDKKNASCNINNGTIKVRTTGGTGTRTYSWGHISDNVDSVSNLSPGKYKVTVYDTKGCTWNDSIIITQQGFPSVSISKNDASCRLPNGKAKVSVTNQASVLNFKWSTTGAPTTDSVFGLIPGNYTVSVSDGFGCNIAATTLIGNIGMDSIHFSIFHPRCFINNGRVKAIAVNPLGKVNYLWSTSSLIDSITSLAAGNYTVTVSDSICSNTKTANLVMGTIPVISLVKQDATCGLNNGSVTSTVTKGTPPMTYEWSNSLVSANIFGRDSGTYMVTVTDNYGCRDSISIYVARTPGLNTYYNIVKSKCGLANGSIQVNVTGGFPSYDFTWHTGEKSSTITNKLAGRYILTIKDANTCTRIDTVWILDLKKPLIIDNKLQAVCNKANGAIFITIQDGNPPFKYTWNTGDTTKEIDSLAVGIYRLTVTDSLGCVDNKSIDIDPGTPPYLHPDSTKADRSTCGLKNGKMQALLMRGVSPITYKWSTGDTGQYVGKIAPGKHYLTVEDGRQCITYDSLIVNTTTVPVARLDSTSSFCLKPNGVITTSISLGTTPFKYKWNHGASTQNAINVLAGVYTLTVTDSLGCADTVSTQVIEEPNLVTATYDTFRLNCYNDFTGRVVFHASGGLSPYLYTIVTNSPDSVRTGLGAGRYDFVVTDNKGCTYQDSFFITQPDSISLKLDSIKLLTCHNRSDGMLQVSAKGGNGGYNFTWSPSGQPRARATQLGDGVHVITVRDANGCMKDTSYTLINPPQIVIKSGITDNLCFGESKGAIKLNPSFGVPPYRFKWSNGDTTRDVQQLKNGIYKLTMVDKVGCEILRQDTVRSPFKLIPGIALPIDLACREQLYGEIEIKNTKDGVAPYLFGISGLRPLTMSNKFTDLKPGNYKIYIQDKNGCIDSIQTEIKGYPLFNIKAYPKDTTLTMGESVQLGFDVVEGSASWINHAIWSESEGLSCTDCYSPLATTFVSKNYAVEVKYNNRCYVYDTVKIKIIDDNDLYIPNSFAPAASNIENRSFRVYANKVIRAELMIFNRWGEKMYETDEGHLVGWDGIYKGEPAPTAVYIYYVRVTYLNGRKVVRKGDVTLVR